MAGQKSATQKKMKRMNYMEEQSQPDEITEQDNSYHLFILQSSDHNL